MTGRISDKTDESGWHRRLHNAALVVLLAAAFPGFEISARANAVIINGNFASTSDSGLTNGQAINIYGSSTNNTTYSLTGWSQCTSSSGCPSGSTATGNGSNALAFLYTYGSQADKISDSFGVNNFSLTDSSAIPNTYPGACTTPTTGCGNYLAIDGAPSYDMAIYQSVTNLTVGANYALTFYTAAGQQSGNTNATTEDWAVYFGTASLTTSVIDNPGGSFTPWSLVTMNFTATTTSQILEFLAQGGPAGDPPMDLLADVVLTQTPEPSGMALVGVGMLSLLAVRRRRRA
jgi:hypothetical protein